MFFKRKAKKLKQPEINAINNKLKDTLKGLIFLENEEYENMLEQYIEMFDEGFPISVVRSKTGEEIKEIIQRCIDAKKPYTMDYPDDDSDY